MRLIAGFFCFLITPLAAFYAVIGLWNNPSNWKKFYSFFLVTIFILAYSYNPVGKSEDLVRYLADIEYLGKMSLWKALQHYNDGLFIRTVVFWIVGKIGVPHLVPAISTTIVYGIAVYITCMTAKLYHAEKCMWYVMLAQLMILPFNSIVNNVRNVCSFSLIVLAAYKDLVLKQKLSHIIWLYIIPCFIHASAALLAVIGVLAHYIKKPRAWMILVVLIAPGIIQFLYSKIGLINGKGYVMDLVRTFIEKGYNYSDTGTLMDYEREVMKSSFWKLHRITMMSFSVFIFIHICMAHDELNRFEGAGFNSYISMICIVIVLCNIMPAPNYWRFFSALIVAIPTVLIPTIIMQGGKSLSGRIMLYVLPLFMCGRFMMEIYYSLPTTDYGELFVGFMCNNVFSIMSKILSNIL